MHLRLIQAAVLAVAAASAAILAGCAGPPPPSLAPSLAADSAAWYRQAASAGQRVLAIDRARSLVAVTVRRGGTLARLGHDHVVASRGVTGLVAPDLGRADFQFRLDDMTVDEPGLRLLARLDTQPGAAAVAATRTNMLTRVLDAQRFPLVLLRAERVPGRADTLRIAVTLQGVTRIAWVPTLVENTAAGIAASGSLLLRQSEFGITPLSILGGAMTVQDTMEVRFRIEARPAPAPG